MRFRTEMSVPREMPRLDPEKPLLFLGSCFAQNMSRELRAMLWDARVNPAGILFNPLSIWRSLKIASLPAAELSEEVSSTLIERDGLYYSRLADTSFYGRTPEEAASRICGALAALRRDVEESQCVLITLGTAYVYEWKVTGEVVANCHKLPAGFYNRRRMDVAECAAVLTKIQRIIGDINPHATVIYTVSPVRHLRDGFSGNSRSKAVLHLAVEQSEAAYFPAYEILLDDLRDYRFYDSDLVHPSGDAVEYIRDIFLEACVDRTGMTLLGEAAALARRAAHRPLNEDSMEARDFRIKTALMFEEFAGEHPGMLNHTFENG